MNIDPSNNIFYASNAGDGAGYNHYKILMTNNPAFVQDQGKIKAPNTSNEQINRIQKKRRIQAMQFGGSSASQTSNFTFEQPSIKSLKSTPLDTEGNSSFQHSCASPAHNPLTEREGSLPASSTKGKKADRGGEAQLPRPSSAVDDYNQFFKAAIKMSGIKVKEYSKMKAQTHRASNNSLRSEASRKSPRDQESARKTARNEKGKDPHSSKASNDEARANGKTEKRANQKKKQGG